MEACINWRIRRVIPQLIERLWIIMCLLGGLIIMGIATYELRESASIVLPIFLGLIALLPISLWCLFDGLLRTFYATDESIKLFDDDLKIAEQLNISFDKKYRDYVRLDIEYAKKVREDEFSFLNIIISIGFGTSIASALGTYLQPDLKVLLLVVGIMAMTVVVLIKFWLIILEKKSGKKLFWLDLADK